MHKKEIQMHHQDTKARRFNGFVHYEADMHAGVSKAPEGRHDYEAFECGSQLPDGLLRIVDGNGYRWNLARYGWEVAA